MPTPSNRPSHAGAGLSLPDTVCQGELGFPCWHPRGHDGAHHWPDPDKACDACLLVAMAVPKEAWGA